MPKKPRQPKEEPEFNGAVVSVDDAGEFSIAPAGNVKPRELPTLLRQAAAAAEKCLGVSQ